MGEIEISIYNIEKKTITTIFVEHLSENTFRMIENDIFNLSLTKGTEFKTLINKNGQHEISSITKKSEYQTLRFNLPKKYKESEYLMLSEEIEKHGGFWQVDFGIYATINLPNNFEYDVYEVAKQLGITLYEKKLTNSVK